MRFDGIQAEIEKLGDLFVRLQLRKKLQDLTFARGERSGGNSGEILILLSAI